MRPTYPAITLAALCLWSAAALAEAPPDSPLPMSKYLHITVKDGSLVAEVTPPEPDPQDAANPPPAAGFAANNVRTNVKVAGVDGDITFMQRGTSLSVTRSGTAGSSTISITASSISLGRTIIDPASGTLRVTFQQRNLAARGGAQNSVTLTVTSIGGIGGRGGSNVVTRLSEPTFADMWTRHPQEMRQYVEPLFREMGMPSIFEVTLEEVRPLFAALDATSPNLAAAKARVDDLLNRLSSDSWQQRESARTDLLAMGSAAVPVLKDIPIDDLPVEAAAAVKSALSAVVDSRLNDPDFLLRCVAIDDPAIAARAAAEFQKITGKKLDIDLSQPAAQRARQVEKLRMGDPAQTEDPPSP